MCIVPTHCLNKNNKNSIRLTYPVNTQKYKNYTGRSKPKTATHPTNKRNSEMPPWQSTRRTIFWPPGDPWPLPQSPRPARAPQNSNLAKPVLPYVFFLILVLWLCSLFEANLSTLQKGISHLPLPIYFISFRALKIPTPYWKPTLSHNIPPHREFPNIWLTSQQAILSKPTLKKKHFAIRRGLPENLFPLVRSDFKSFHKSQITLGPLPVLLFLTYSSWSPLLAPGSFFRGRAVTPRSPPSNPLPRCWWAPRSQFLPPDPVESPIAGSGFPSLPYLFTCWVRTVDRSSHLPTPWPALHLRRRGDVVSPRSESYKHSGEFSVAT